MKKIFSFLKWRTWKKVNYDMFIIEVKEIDILLNLMHFIRLCHKYALKTRNGLSTFQVSNINISHHDTLIIIITGNFTADNSCYLIGLEYKMFKESHIKEKRKPEIHAVLMPS